MWFLTGRSLDLPAQDNSAGDSVITAPVQVGVRNSRHQSDKQYLAGDSITGKQKGASFSDRPSQAQTSPHEGFAIQ